MPTLTWIGKDKVVNHHQEVPYRVLEHKYGFRAEDDGDRTPTGSGNKIIHGDNLEALKSLLPEYEGRVKCIYIDPPYNTGNEKWVYNDNVNDPKIKKWLGEVVGKQGEDLSRHDKWLCMMYPRLKLLHKLLAEDGAIFISIDDNELANLKLLCDEIFGITNYLGLITRRQSSGSKNDKGNDKIITTADYILTYRKNNFAFSPYQQKNTKIFPMKDDIGNFSIRALEMQGGGDTLPQRPKMGYSVYYNRELNDVKLLFDYDLSNIPVYKEPDTELIQNGYECFRPRKRDMALGRWRWGDATFLERFYNNGVYFDKGRVFIKERFSETIDKYPEAIISEFLNTQGTNELKQIFECRIFDYPKPSDLLYFLFSVSTDKNAIVLDSFAGSGTTAHAVLNLNKKDGGNRKFILVEMEDYAEDITAERVRRVMRGYGEGKNAVAGTGGAFDYYELGEPMFDKEKNLNENIGEDKIREYIYYTETKRHLERERTEAAKYLLDTYNNTGYYFYYERDRMTTLSIDTLHIVTERAEQYVIYADVCTVPPQVLAAQNITFKKIPRDIKRF
ncbi:MAG: site-specific DNA-methyltransferase [Bacteroidaceae bacterium]|nr:site-specific DNA-methyltransferase [Bacteroidaceae bacterium]